MTTKYRFAFRQDDSELRKLFGDLVEPFKPTDIIVVATIDEQMDNFSRIYRAAIQKVSPIVITKFSKTELDSSRYLRVLATWHHQYPQPEDDFGYIEKTFTTACMNCGYAEGQKEPYRIKHEPKWGNKRFMQLNWQFDSLFVETEFYDTFLKKYGVETLPVLHWKTGTAFSTVRQLIPSVGETENFPIEGQKKTSCEVCARIRYLPFTTNFFPISQSIGERPLYLTKNRFGGGGRDNHGELLLRNDLYRTLKASKIKGIDFYGTRIV